MTVTQKTFGQMTVSQMTFAQMASGQMTGGQMTVGPIDFNQNDVEPVQHDSAVDTNLSFCLPQVMLQCWEIDLDERPDFEHLSYLLSDLAQQGNVSG